MQAGEVRIIGGHWRSRRIEVQTAENLRPTGDRVRETLFNWLGQSLAGQRCLDLFAGTGVLGFEALSRLAASVDWVESNPKVARALRTSLAVLSANDPVPGRGAVHQMDAFSFLSGRGTDAYDVVFLDPPFVMNRWEVLLPHVLPRVAQRGKVYIEAPERPAALNPPPDGWLIIRESRAGAVWFALLQREYSQDSDPTSTMRLP